MIHFLQKVEIVNINNTSKDAMAWGILRDIAYALDLTKSQRELAEERYAAVAKVLSKHEHPLLSKALVYPQGSYRTGTAVKPIKSDEFDIDLVCHIPVNSSSYNSKHIYDLIGKALAGHKKYEKILEPKKRCWRLNYAGDFHMDITPSTIDETHHAKGEMVPDRALSMWKASNPIGFANWVATIDKLSPSIIMERSLMLASASIEPLPSGNEFKGIMKTYVQLIKRHRDIHFVENPFSSHAPISILLTTITARAYRACVASQSYTSGLDLFIDIVDKLPLYVKKGGLSSFAYYEVKNPAHNKENFAEKWNEDPSYFKAFELWQSKFLKDLKKIKQSVHGVDEYAAILKTMFGDQPVGSIMSSMGQNMASLKNAGGLNITAGLGVTSTMANSAPITKNTFYGS